MSRHSKRKNNKNQYPNYDDLLEYGLGSWLSKNKWVAAVPGIGTAAVGLNELNKVTDRGLEKNAGTIGGIAGGVIGSIVAPGVGTGIGASLGSQIGGTVQKDYEMDKQNEYINEQNQLTQSQISANELLGRNYRNNSFNPVMRCGGKMMRRGGLIFENGGSIDYNVGQLHEGPNGGIPIDMNGNPNKMNPSALVEKGEVSYKNGDGTYIFSNSLMKDKNNSWADNAKSIKSKYKMRMKDGKINDPISLRAYNKEMDELVKGHEQHRNALGINNNTNEFDGGGYLFNKSNDQFNNSNKFLPQVNSYQTRDYEGIDPINELQSLNPNIGGMNNKLATGSSINSSKVMAGMNTEPTPYSGLSMLEAGLPVAASALSNLYLANRAKRNQPRLSLGRSTPQTIDLSEERGSIREQGNLARAMAQRGLLASGASQGQAMANTGAINAGLSRDIGQQLSSSYKTEALTNLDSRKEADRTNTEMATREASFNTQAKMQTEADRNKYIGAALSSLPMGLRDYVQSQKDAELLNMMYPNYQLTSDRNPYWGFGRQGKNRVRFTPRNQKFNE